MRGHFPSQKIAMVRATSYEDVLWVCNAKIWLFHNMAVQIGKQKNMNSVIL